MFMENGVQFLIKKISYSSKWEFLHSQRIMCRACKDHKSAGADGVNVNLSGQSMAFFLLRSDKKYSELLYGLYIKAPN